MICNLAFLYTIKLISFYKEDHYITQKKNIRLLTKESYLLKYGTAPSFEQ